MTQSLAFPRVLVQEQAVGGLQRFVVIRGDFIGGRPRKQIDGRLADDGRARQAELSLGDPIDQEVTAITRILDRDL